MAKHIKQVERFLIICFAAMGLALGYWQLFRADDLLVRGDNPRLVVAAQRIERGPILAADGTVLAESKRAENGVMARHYPLASAAPVVGYYSLRYGTSGLEAAYNRDLRGDATYTAWADLIHLPQIGQPITTTLDAQAQQQAMIALAETQATGSIIILDAETGAIRVMVSQPTFEPNSLETDWDGLIADSASPLLNRATQGLFPLGEMARLIGLIARAESSQVISDDDLERPLADLFAPLTATTLIDTATQLQLTTEVDFDLPTAAAALPLDLPEKIQEVTVTPLHLARVGGAILQNGLAPQPVLVQSQPGSNPLPPLILSPTTARQLQAHLTDLAGLAASDVTGNQPLSWYLGLRQKPTPQVMVVVITSPSADGLAAQRIGRRLLGDLGGDK